MSLLGFIPAVGWGSMPISVYLTPFGHTDPLTTCTLLPMKLGAGNIVLHGVQKKTPTHIFFHISVSDVQI